MKTIKARRVKFCPLSSLLLVGLIFSLPGGRVGMAQDLLQTMRIKSVRSTLETTFHSTLVRTTDLGDLDPPSPGPSGLTYLSFSNTLLISDAEVEETVGGNTHFQGANLWEINLAGSLLRTANISKVPPTFVPMTNEPTGAAWNLHNGHYYFSDDTQAWVCDLNPGADGLVGTQDDTWMCFSTDDDGSGDPEGIAYDSWHDRLFIVDGFDEEVYQFTTTGSLVGHFDVQQYGVSDPEGIEFNPIRGTLFILSSAANDLIIETTLNGELLQTIDVSANLAIAPAGLAYAPASDDSGVMHFYIVDRGIDNITNPDIVDGKMYEMTAPSSFDKISPTSGATGQPLSLELAWDKASAEASYEYCYDASNDNLCSGWISTGTTNSVVLNSLSPDTTYFWQARLLDGFGAIYADGSSTAFAWFSTISSSMIHLPLVMK